MVVFSVVLVRRRREILVSVCSVRRHDASGSEVAVEETGDTLE
jgi:hypothetical protein